MTPLGDLAPGAQFRWRACISRPFEQGVVRGDVSILSPAYVCVEIDGIRSWWERDREVQVMENGCTP